MRINRINNNSEKLIKLTNVTPPIDPMPKKNTNNV